MSTNLPPHIFMRRLQENPNANIQKQQNVSHNAKVDRRKLVQNGQVTAEEAFNKYFGKNSEGRISQQDFNKFWDDLITSPDEAKAIYAHYDPDNNGMDAEEYAKYQNEYVSSLKSARSSQEASQKWESSYRNAVAQGEVDYSKISGKPVFENKETRPVKFA